MSSEVSIRHELTRTFMFAVASVALLSASVVSWYAGDRLINVVIAQAHELTENFATRASLAVLTRDNELLHGYAQSVLESTRTTTSVFPPVRSIVVADTNWQVLYQTGDAVIPSDLRAQMLRQSWLRTQSLTARGLIEVATQVLARDTGTEGAQRRDRLFGYLILTFDRSGTDDFINGLRLGGALAGVVFGSLVAGWLRVRISRLTRPLSRLATAMAQTSERTDGTTVTPEGPTEVRDMALAFNFMMHKISRAQRDLEDAVRKATEDAQVALEIAENESQAKSDLLTRVSHEFRQPLNNILAYSETLIHKMSFMNAPVNDIEQDLARVLQNTKRLAHLVDDLLLVRQMARERLQAQFSLFSLRQVMDDVLAEIQPVCETRGNRVINALTGNEWIKADRDKVRIVLSNLLGNSAKFTANGEIQLHLEVHPEELAIDVIDTGIGIDPEAQNDIFKIFQRGAKERMRAYPGVGAGLWIVKELVTLMGGEVDFISTVNRGSHFWVRLPLEAQQIPANAVD